MKTIKIIWIINIPCLGLAELANISKEHKSSGGWLISAIKDFACKQGYEIAVATTFPRDSIVKKSENNITYYLLGGGYPSQYNHKKKVNLAQWDYVFHDFKPDIIQVWGTEMPHGLAAIKAMPNIPHVIYAQGIVTDIARYYLSGMSKIDLLKSQTIKTLLFRKSIQDQQNKFYKKAKIEKEIYSLSQYVVGENDWCRAHSLELNPLIKFFFSHLPINNIFFNYSWKIENVQRNTIFCNASGYPIKGTHILLKALAIVKQNNPKVLLRIPGMKKWEELSLKTRMEGYYNYLHKLILELNLLDNVEFLGSLTQTQMAEQISTSNLYVMPSCIENHSSSLIEAMCVGAPCIASAVGGVPEYVDDGVNGILYRFEDYHLLALRIGDLLGNDLKCIQLSNNALNSTRKYRLTISQFEEMSKIYNYIINSEK